MYEIATDLLPRNWFHIESKAKPGAVYFYNIKTKVSTWEMPTKSVKPASTIRAKHILLKHKDVRNPVSKGKQAGVAVTRTREEAIEQITKYYEEVARDPESFHRIAVDVSDCNSSI